jgi:hypothetical protein
MKSLAFPTVLDYPLLKAIWRSLKKLKIELPYDLAISLLGISLK